MIGRNKGVQDCWTSDTMTAACSDLSAAVTLASSSRWEYSPHKFSDPSAAQHTRTERFAAAISHAEVESLLAAATVARKAGCATLRRTQDGGEYRTTWLQAAPLPNAAAAGVSKRVALMQTADAKAAWNLLGEPYQVRCVEFHEYESNGQGDKGLGTGAPDLTHYDSGSLITLDLMLSATADFEGGSFATPEADGALQQHIFERGDALVFVSHKYHHVAPVVCGTRCVLVIELWRGPQRSCPHRCLDPLGQCRFTRADIDGGDGTVCELLPWLSLGD